MLGKKFCFIQHPFQDLLQSVPADQGQKKPVSFTTVLHAGDIPLRNILFVFNKPIQSSLKGWEFVDKFRLQCEDGIQRNQTDQRPNWGLLGPLLAVRDGIIVETVYISGLSI